MTRASSVDRSSESDSFKKYKLWHKVPANMAMTGFKILKTDPCATVGVILQCSNAVCAQPYRIYRSVRLKCTQIHVKIKSDESY